ncbi:MAG: kelch repeat-containing protein, partial [Chthoniobacteraceae bacterium]
MNAFPCLFLRVIVMACLLASRVMAGGTWTPLANTPPGPVGVMLLLSDGTVIAENNDDGSINGPAWYRLTPNGAGSYVNGTWSAIAPMNDGRLFFSSQVLKDGRVFVAGGEYPNGGAGQSAAEVYGPLTNTWTRAPALSPSQFISDAESTTLPNGDVLVAPVVANPYLTTYIWHLASNTWTAGPQSQNNLNEAAWVKLPDGSILTIDTGSFSTERYIPSLNQWIPDTDAPVDLYDPYGDETGPGFLLPNGKAFFIGSTGHTAIYTPSGGTANGTWTAGPDIPNAQGMPDAPGAMLPNGNLLIATGPAPTSKSTLFIGPTSYYEYDYVSNTFTQVGAPGGASTEATAVFQRGMLVLPDGSVLSSVFTNRLHVYTPNTGSPLAAGKPTITSLIQNGNGSFHVIGTKLNGISEGAAYGDDAQMATNYPIVRFTDSLGTIRYARTFNWSSTGVQTGNTPVSTDFTLPAGLPLT